MSQTRSINEILSEIAERIQEARAVPLSASVMVNKAELLELIDEVRDALPCQIAQADRNLDEASTARSAAVEEADLIVAEARAEAKRIEIDAKHRARKLVEAEDVNRQARAEATHIIAAARADAVKLLNDADTHCDDRFAGLEEELRRMLAQASAGRRRLVERIQERSEE